MSGSAIISTALAGGAQHAEGAAFIPQLRSSVAHLTNVARDAPSCKPLKVSARPIKAAQRHATDMSAKNYSAHTAEDGRPWDVWIRADGRKGLAGEAIAYGFDGAVDVVTAWPNSPGHERNNTDRKYK